MSGPIQSLSQAVRRLWTGKSGKSDLPPASDMPGFIVHDPKAAGPHDLDDPFFDRAVQARMADVIAGTHQSDKKK